MKIFLNPKLKILTSSLAVAVVLLLAVFSGMKSGKTKAQSEAVVKTASQVMLALNYYYSDQNYYPSAYDFSEQAIMQNYLDKWPLPDFALNNCQTNFLYKKLGASSAQLQFCLAAAAGSYQTGWNTVNLNK